MGWKHTNYDKILIEEDKKILQEATRRREDLYKYNKDG